MVDEETLAALVTELIYHCQSRDGEITGDDWMNLCLKHHAITKTVKPGRNGRGELTRETDSIRRRVRSRLQNQGLTLDLQRRHPTVHVLRDSVIGGMASLKDMPEDVKRIAMQRIGFMVKVWTSGSAMMAKYLPADKVELFKDRAERRAIRNAEDELADWHYLWHGLSIDFPEELKKYLPDAPARLKRRRRNLG